MFRFHRYSKCISNYYILSRPLYILQFFPQTIVAILRNLQKGSHQFILHLPQVNEDVGDITVSGSGVKYANIMRPADFLVDPHGPSSAPITAIAEGPTRTVPVAMEKQSDGSCKASFVPTEMGEHKITVMVGSRPLPGCPFICKVGDPSKVVFTPHGQYRTVCLVVSCF